MTKALQDIKDWITNMLGAIGIVINYDNIYGFVFGLLSLFFLIYQIRSKKNENKLTRLTLEKLELELKKLKSEKEEE